MDYMVFRTDYWGLFLSLLFAANCYENEWPISTVTEMPSHYPGFARFTNIVLNSTEQCFKYHTENGQKLNAFGVQDVWPLKETNSSVRNCDRIFNTGITYTIFYWGRSSNYYHLTYDMMIPLFKHMQNLNNFKGLNAEDVLFMPVVETSRLQVLDWNTAGFEDPSKYWVTMSKFMAGSHVHLPLDQHTGRLGETLCFDELYFGAPGVVFKDEQLIKAFVGFVKGKLNITEQRPRTDRMALVSRKGRRKILNEVELVEALQDVVPTDLLEFSGMTFEQQVIVMQNYTVFAALNGAGLMNSLYLPEHSTAIQMVPYRAGLNVKQYGNLIKTRGPYLEWFNTHEELHHSTQNDKHNNQPDTTVHIEEFKQFVGEALQLSRDAYLNSLKGEL